MEENIRRLRERVIYLNSLSSDHTVFEGVDLKPAREFREGDIIGEVEHFYGRHYQTLVCSEEAEVVLIPHRVYDRYIVRSSIDRLLEKFTDCEQMFRFVMRPAYFRFCELYTCLSTHKVYRINTALNPSKTYLIIEGEVTVLGHDLQREQKFDDQEHKVPEELKLLKPKPIQFYHQINSTVLHVFTKHDYTFMPSDHGCGRHYDPTALKVSSEKLCVFEMSLTLFEIITRDRTIHSFFKNLSDTRFKKLDDKVTHVMTLNDRLASAELKQAVHQAQEDVLDGDGICSKLEMAALPSRVKNKKKRHWKNVDHYEGNQMKSLNEIKEELFNSLGQNLNILSHVTNLRHNSGRVKVKEYHEKSSRNLKEDSVGLFARISLTKKSKEGPQKSLKASTAQSKWEKSSTKAGESRLMIKGMQTKGLEVMLSAKSYNSSKNRSPHRYTYSNNNFESKTSDSRPITAQPKVVRVSSAPYRPLRSARLKESEGALSNQNGLMVVKSHTEATSTNHAKIAPFLAHENQFISRKYIIGDHKTQDLEISDAPKILLSPKAAYLNSVPKFVANPNPIRPNSAAVQNPTAPFQRAKDNSSAFKEYRVTNFTTEPSTSSTFAEAIFSNAKGLGQKMNQTVQNKKLVERVLKMPRFVAKQLDDN